MPVDTLLIDQSLFETRAALLQDEKLVALYIDRPNQTTPQARLQVGNIYRGRVKNIVPSLQACFVDIGQGANGFLPVNAALVDDISQLHEGQTLIVQVKQLPHGDKGAVLSCKIDLSADHCVLTPKRPGINVSRKFQNSDLRTTFKAALKDLLDEDCGLVVRTSAEHHAPSLIRSQAQGLHEKWQHINQNNAPAPCLLQSADDFYSALLRSINLTSLKQVLIEGLDAFQRISPQIATAQLYSNPTALFENYGVEDQIDAALSPIVPLEGGAHLVIEPTAALVAIDINMAQATDRNDNEESIQRTNLAALPVLKEQVALRNLSGQILIDFINLKSRKSKARLEEAAKEAFKDSDIQFHGLTRLGLGEMTRPHQGPTLHDLYDPIQRCFSQLIRDLQKGGLIRSLALGSDLYRFWQKNPPKGLSHRLGFEIKPTEDKNLAPKEFRLER